jgi:surface polysaccharide O-acyltransferase-like enzyme
MDALRAVAMLLGVVLHGSMAYMTQVWSIWAADDPASSPVFDIVFNLIHVFRMQVFFLIAGFFACMLAARYGQRGFAAHRLKRIGIPLLLGMVTVIPMCHVVWAWGFNLRLPPEHQLSFVQAVSRWVSNQPLAAAFNTWHLWFLLHLLVLYAFAVVWIILSSRIRPLAWAAQRVTDGWAWCIRHALAAPVLAIASFPLLFLQDGPGVDTQAGPIPDFTIIAYYLVFFAGGWMLYARREVLPSLARLWIPLTAVGLSLAIVNLALLGKLDAETSTALLLPRALSALATASLVVGVCGLFLRLFHGHSPAMRYVSDSAYWIYLIHLPLVVWLNIVVQPLGAGALTKFAIVMLASTAVMYLSYHIFVRYTWIGVILNGPRLREERKARKTPTIHSTPERPSPEQPA